VDVVTRISVRQENENLEDLADLIRRHARSTRDVDSSQTDSLSQQFRAVPN
jgi:hypothetical protein